MKTSIYLIIIITVLSFKTNAQNTQQTPVDSIIRPTAARPIQKSPSFPDGSVGFNAFIKNNVHYPAQAINNKAEGRAIVTFVVEKDGSLSNLKIGHDPGSGLGEEAIRILKLSPKWSPGIDNNKPVRVQMAVPVNFSLP